MSETVSDEVRTRLEGVRDLLEARLIAKLATFNEDGTIHLVSMWYLWDGEVVRMATNHGTRKLKNLQRDPRATVMIDDSRGGLDLRGVTIVARARLVGEPRSRELNREVHARYITERGLALPEVADFTVYDDTTIELVPERVSTWDNREFDAAKRLAETGEFHRLSPVL